MTDTDRAKRDLRARMEQTRARTLRLMTLVSDEFLKVRVHDFYSPIGWHFGHIGRTEELWACENALHRAPLDDRLSLLFVNVPENPKDGRVHLPSRDEIVAYLEETRRRAFEALDTADFASLDPLLRDGYAWEFARLHECQHGETISELLQLIGKWSLAEISADDSDADPEPPSGKSGRETSPPTRSIPLPSGVFTMGSADPFAYDNEKPPHPVTVAGFALDETPVTAGQWLDFLGDGGYRRPELWHADGWAWREVEGVFAPEYWHAVGNGFSYIGPNGLRGIHVNEPVSSISWYEADAYARWAGQRLPTEAEWEYAAAFDPRTDCSHRFPWGDTASASTRACLDGNTDAPAIVGSYPEGASARGLLDMTGGVWEWTASPFLPYPGFTAYPYDGYSAEHMDGLHFVCKGGSWATAPDIARCAFRNWYVPTYRQGFLGMRCAR